MRAVLMSGLTLASLALSTTAHAAGTLADWSPELGGTTQWVAGLITLGVLYVLKTRPARVVKLDTEGRRYDPNVRGLFDD